MEAKLAEEELGLRGSKRDPPKLTTPYVTKADSYTPGGWLQVCSSSRLPGLLTSGSLGY